MGIWMDALWHAWRVLDAEGDVRAAAVRRRLIDMATFYRDIPLDDNGFLRLHLGYNVETNSPSALAEIGHRMASMDTRGQWPGICVQVDWRPFVSRTRMDAVHELAGCPFG